MTKSPCMWWQHGPSVWYHLQDHTSCLVPGHSQKLRCMTSQVLKRKRPILQTRQWDWCWNYSPVQVSLIRPDNVNSSPVRHQCRAYHQPNALSPQKDVRILTSHPLAKLTLPPPVTTATIPSKSNIFFALKWLSMESAMLAVKSRMREREEDGDKMHLEHYIYELDL